MKIDGKQDKNQSQNIILMEVVPERDYNRREEEKGKSDQPNSYIIGGYASHQWKANNSERGDDTCFLFNLTQNLRFNARSDAPFYQKTEIHATSQVRYIQFGHTDLVIHGPEFGTVTSTITPTS